jgi:HEXXH motif-containing protein
VPNRHCIRAQVEASVGELQPLWFPGLAAHLVELDDFRDFDLRAYGTHRWLVGNQDAPRDEAASLSVCDRLCIVEALQLQDQAFFPDLSFREPTATDIEGLRGALALIERLPTLAKAVSLLARCIHVLSSHPDYDVSHSDPNLPFSIFVSVPPKDGPQTPMRLMESIIHEAMHLQLTLMERVAPMVEGVFSAHSPWQRQLRPAQGLLHGLYVFAVICQALNDPRLAQQLAAASVRKRTDQIRDEVSSLDSFDAGLSALGRTLASRARLVVMSF